MSFDRIRSGVVDADAAISSAEEAVRVGDRAAALGALARAHRALGSVLSAADRAEGDSLLRIAAHVDALDGTRVSDLYGDTAACNIAHEPGSPAPGRENTMGTRRAVVDFLTQRRAWVDAGRPACRGWWHWAQAEAQWSFEFGGTPVAWPGGEWHR